MRSLFSAAAIAIASVLASCARSQPAPDRTAGASASASASDTPVIAAHPGESRLANIRQLTAGGENAEAYFSANGRQLIFQSTRDGRRCDQQYTMRTDGSGLRRVSPGVGKTTCGFFYANDQRILYASTHAADSTCPPRPDPSRGYVWRLDPFDLFTANADGSGLTRLTDYGVYTAEATVSPDGRTLVFTSLKDGDLDIYTMNVDGTNVRRLTSAPGYDGGPFFSPDGTRIVYRAHHPSDSASLATYRTLLGDRMIRPNRMEIWVMNADGSDQRQITSLGGANWAPFFAPGGHQIIFASNHRAPRSGNFDLYLVNLDGTGLEQITTSAAFDGFPMFSPDGTQLVWASNRNAVKEGETNVFIADWKAGTGD